MNAQPAIIKHTKQHAIPKSENRPTLVSTVYNSSKENELTAMNQVSSHYRECSNRSKKAQRVYDCSQIVLITPAEGCRIINRAQAKSPIII
jgi:hypothetical protein